MFKHIVCMKFVDEKEAVVVKNKLDALVGVVPTLKTMEVGLDELRSERSWDLILISTFDDKASYLEYDKHPEHEKVRQYIATVREAGCAIDYEF